MKTHLKIKKARELMGFNQSQFAKAVGVTQKDVSLLESGNKKFIPNMYIEFLLKSKFDLNSLFDDALEIDHLVPNQVYKLRTDSNIQEQAIPLYDIEAVAGLVPLFTNAQETKPIDHISIPNLPKCDGAVHITGDSMYPLLKSGDIIMYKEIQDIANDIFWGEMYLLSISMSGEEMVVVKFLQKSDKGEGYVKLVSQNKHHQDRDIKITRIMALALVKASVRINSMS